MNTLKNKTNLIYLARRKKKLKNKKKSQRKKKRKKNKKMILIFFESILYFDILLYTRGFGVLGRYRHRPTKQPHVVDFLFPHNYRRRPHRSPRTRRRPRRQNPPDRSPQFPW